MKCGYCLWLLLGSIETRPREFESMITMKFELI